MDEVEEDEQDDPTIQGKDAPISQIQHTKFDEQDLP